jgi:hypothetical protein
MSSVSLPSVTLLTSVQVNQLARPLEVGVADGVAVELVAA